MDKRAAEEGDKYFLTGKGSTGKMNSADALFSESKKKKGDISSFFIPTKKKPWNIDQAERARGNELFILQNQNVLSSF